MGKLLWYSYGQYTNAQGQSATGTLNPFCVAFTNALALNGMNIYVKRVYLTSLFVTMAKTDFPLAMWSISLSCSRTPGSYYTKGSHRAPYLVILCSWDTLAYQGSFKKSED